MRLDMESPVRPGGWYVVAGNGDVVLRVHSGMKLGEDSTGELTLEPADAQVEFHIGDDGNLILLACRDHELETEPGKRLRRVEASRRCRLHVRLIRSDLSIDTDFAGTSTPQERLEIRTVRTEASEDAPILVPEVVRTASGRPAPVPPNARARAPRTGARRRAASIAIGSVITLAGIYATYQIRDSSPIETPPSTGSEVETGNGPANVIEAGAPSEPDVAHALANVAALLENEPLANESSLRVALQSLKALSVAYPNDLQVQQTLEQLAERLDSAAQASHDVGEALVAASSARVEAESAPTLPATLPVEPVAPPAVPRRAIAKHPAATAADLAEPTVPAGDNAISAVPTARSTVRAAPSEQSESVDWERIGAALQSIAAAQGIRQDDRLRSLSELTAIRQDPPVYRPSCTRGWGSSWCPGFSPTGIEQSVDIEMTVSETGEVSKVEVLGDPPRRFARAARQAVTRWRFEPVVEHGRPMPVRTAVRITFRDE